MGYKDYTGEKFGQLTAIKFNRRENKHTYWDYKCDCGNIKTMRADGPVSGKVKGCGCLGETHGETKNYAQSKLYRLWVDMKRRCYCTTYKRYKDWGGRGIKVNYEWAKDFLIFKAWALNNGFKEGLSVDRIDNDGDYSPNNCRFATSAEQARNRRSNKIDMDIANRMRDYSVIYNWSNRQIANVFNVKIGMVQDVINERCWAN